MSEMLTSAGVKVLDGTVYEQNEVGFAGTKGFVGGFGRSALTAFGEPEIKNFVKAAMDEGVKLERAMAQLRTPKRVVVLHYAPIAATVAGESPEIFCYLGTSRLIEVVDRGGAWTRAPRSAPGQEYGRYRCAQCCASIAAVSTTAGRVPDFSGVEHTRIVLGAR